jgi:hypothetical protein
MALMAQLKLNILNLEVVQNLILEADMAVQILESEPRTPMIDAVKEGLESALRRIREEK